MKTWLLRCVLILLCAGGLPAEAAITVTYGAAGQTSGLGSFTLSLSPPAGTASGDVLIAQIATPGTQVTTFTPPAGWTLITPASVTGGTNLDQRIYYLTLGAAAAASYDWTVWDWSYQSTGVIYAVRGAKAPDCAAAATANCAGSRQAGAGSSVTAPNVGSSFAVGSLRMAFFSDANGSTTITPSTSNGETLGRYNRAGSGATGMGIYGSYYLLTSAGNGGSSTATLSNSQSNVGSTLLLAPAAASIDHIQLEVAASPLTCTPASVTVKACADSSCSTLASSSATVTLSSTSGSWASSPLTFTGSSTTTLAVLTTSATTLGATSSPAASNATQCYVGGVAAASCALSFADSGLLLSIPSQTAGVTSSGATRFSVAAVKKSDNGLSCTPAFASVTRSVKFWSTYSSPASGTKTLAVQGTTIATASPGTAISLSFDSTGTASGLTLNYLDAGQLTLNAQYDGSAGTSDTGLVMTGSTAFVTVPYALCVDSPDANWGCTAADTSCTKFTSAGTAFNLRVTGKAYQAATATCSLPTTPNYIQSNLALSSTLVAPSGGVNASLNPTTISVASAGTATQATQTVSEVGVFTITATPPAGAYFGSYTVPPGSSANSGRFVPAGFTVTSNTLNDRSDINTSTTIGGAETCASSFTYLGEAARALFVLTAANASGVKTQNYTGSFARLTMSPVTSLGSNGLLFGAQYGATPTSLNARLTATCASCGAFASGVANVAADLTVARAAGSTVDGPFTTSFGLVANDADSVGMLSPTYNWDLSGAAEGLSLGSNTLYFGRFKVDGAYGSALQVLPVPAYAQYWTGSVFAKLDGQSSRPGDSCTRLTVPASSSITSGTAAALYCSGGVGLYGSLAGVTASFNGTAPGGTATLLAGDAVVVLAKPTNSGGGYLDFAPSVPAYLQYNWDGVDQSGASCTVSADGYFHDDNPRARIRFGAKRNSAVIYSREVF
jgi:MSHA biogenesis protein MshQ